MAADRHLELCKLLFSDRSRIIIWTGLICLNHANMILYHSAFGSLAGIILIGDQCVPGVYLLFLVVILVWHQDDPPPQQTKTETWFQHQKRIRRLKVSGIRGITLVSVSHWSKSRNSTNPRCYFGGHLWFGIKMTPKHDFNNRNGFVALKISGIRGITLVSVLHLSKSRNSTNPRCYFGGHLGFCIKWPPNIILTPETDFSP